MVGVSSVFQFSVLPSRATSTCVSDLGSCRHLSVFLLLNLVAFSLPDLRVAMVVHVGKFATALGKKKVARKGKTPRMSAEEKRLARKMLFDRGMSPSDVAAALGRHLSSVCRLLAQKKAPRPMGVHSHLAGVPW